MKETLSVLIRMGSLHRLFPFWLLGVFLISQNLSWWIPVALIYGYIAQLFVEYGMHRFLMHREPPKDQGTFNELYRTHIGHHEYPTDPEFFTGDDHWYAVRFGLLSTVIHTAVLWPFLGLIPALTISYIALFVGSVSAFAFYEYCHTIAHLNVPKGRLGQYITRKHLAHHFQDHHATFQVSFGFDWIDRLFGTAHDKATAKERFDRKTMLSMGMDPEDLRLVTARKAFGITEKPGSKTARTSTT
ncbi:sterol desaturase family protein [uncultured Shimia sp.]|uniref:sterol desaturase family protein n=1 Tax=uncultured Shimia sp. TaxID=573152 RepID=UPI0026351097|nr:sterol desaturase family protein [uncultured Shimia sp.]